MQLETRPIPNRMAPALVFVRSTHNLLGNRESIEFEAPVRSDGESRLRPAEGYSIVVEVRVGGGRRNGRPASGRRR